MHDTMERMAKNPQVRVPADLLDEMAFIARAFGETTPRYAARVLRQAVERDRARARKIIDRKLSPESDTEDPE